MFLFVGFFPTDFSLAAQTSLQLSQIGDTLHLEFSGQANWDYEVNKGKEKGAFYYEIDAPQLSDTQLVKLKNFKNNFVTKMDILPAATGKTKLRIYLESEQFEAFDYLTDQPSKLIVDLYRNVDSSKTAKNAKNESEKETSSGDRSEAGNGKKEVSFSDKVKSSSGKKGSRTPANDTLLLNPIGMQNATLVASQQVEQGEPNGFSKEVTFDGGDPEFNRFNIADYEISKESIIQSKDNIYLQFPTLKVQTDYLNKIRTAGPIYNILPEDNDENQQARLLLTLFNNKRYLVFLKTVDWFFKKYETSKYDEIIRFMWADTLYAVWLETKNVDYFDLAMLRYRQAIEKYPTTALLERTMMLMGFSTLDRGDILGTLRLFQSHIKNNPDSENKDIAMLAMAEAFANLNQTETSIQTFEDVEKNAKKEKFKIQAAFSKGDVLFQRKNFQGAIDSYNAAIKKYPHEKNNFANALFNRAAAQFELKNFKESLDLYREFLVKFSTHKFAAYAMTRAGELLEILGASKEKVLGAFLETHFRFGESPEAVVARLRILSIKMKGMKPKELDKAINDISELAKTSEIANIQQFATIMISDGITKRGEYDRSIEMLTKYYQENPTTVDRNLFTSRIVNNICSKIKDQIDAQKFLEALQTHNHYADNWLKLSDRFDVKFNIGKAYEEAGVFVEAESIYKNVLNKIYSIKGTQQEKERRALESLPTEDELNLRLSSVAFEQKKFNLAYDYIKNIKNPSSLTEEDQIKRVVNSAELLEQKGDLPAASRYLVELIKTWAGEPALVAKPYLKLAQIENKMGKKEDALESLNKIAHIMEDSHLVPKSIHSKSLELKGQLELDLDKKDKAIKTYSTLLEQYEKEKPLASIRYRLGELFYSKGDLAKANESWSPLDTPKTEFWYKLAQEKLKNTEFQDQYKKYMKRIPAMDTSEGKSQ